MTKASNKTDKKVSSQMEPIILHPTADKTGPQPKPSPSRHLRLWSISIFFMLLLTTSVVILVVPALGIVRMVDDRFLPQFFFAIISLVVMVNIYFFTQRNRLSATQKDLVRKALLKDSRDELSLLDPITQLLTGTGCFAGNGMAQTGGKSSPISRF